jgi:hypothetical protein
VGHERAHAELLGKGKCLTVRGGSRVDVRGSTMRSDVAEEAQGICLVAAFLVRTGERQRALGKGLRLLQVTSQQMCLTQGKTTGRLKAYHFYGGGLFHRLRNQWYSISDASSQGICRSQSCSHPGEKEREGRFLADAHGPFEPGEGPVQVTLTEGEQPDPVIGPHEAAGVRHCLGDPQPFFPRGTPLSEPAQFGMAGGEKGTGLHRGQVSLPEVFTALCTAEGHGGLPEAVDGPPIVTLGPVGGAKVEVRQRLQDNVLVGRGKREGALGRGNGLVIRAPVAKMD